MLVVELDYSQIELRVAAFIARSQPMLDAYARGDDLHRLMAAQITGKDPVDVTADERQRAKASNFGLLYMQTPEGFQRSEEHTSELQSLMRISYAVFCLKKKNTT